MFPSVFLLPPARGAASTEVPTASTESSRFVPEVEAVDVVEANPDYPSGVGRKGEESPIAVQWDAEGSDSEVFLFTCLKYRGSTNFIASAPSSGISTKGLAQIRRTLSISISPGNAISTASQAASLPIPTALSKSARFRNSLSLSM